MVVEFRVLGLVEAYAGGRLLALGPPQQRLVLAVLAAEVGRVLTAETLIDRVWDEAPDGARRSLHVYITRVRRVLERADTTDAAPARLLRQSGGYVLDADPERVDVHRFRRLVERARDPSCSADAKVVLLREAVGLWREEPLSTMPGGWAARIRYAWRQEYLDAMVAWAHAETHVGTPGVAIGPLVELISEYPLVEPLAAGLMRSLQASGRTGEALNWYRRIRQRLVEELGVDPGPELEALHQAILRGEPTEPPHPDAGPGSMLVPGVPAQLPANLHGLAGRKDQLPRLDSLLAGVVPDKDLSQTERAELERLRRDNAVLRMERDIAKKAAVWLAKTIAMR